MTERRKGKNWGISHYQVAKCNAHTCALLSLWEPSLTQCILLYPTINHHKMSSLKQSFTTSPKVSYTYILCSSVFVAHENLQPPFECMCVFWVCVCSLQGRHLCPPFNTAVTGPWIMEVFGSDKARLTAKRHLYWVVRCDGRVCVCVIPCEPFTMVLMKRHTSPLSLSPHPHVSSSSLLRKLSQPLFFAFLPFPNTQLCHNKTAAVWMRFSRWQRLTRSHNHSYPGATVSILTTR